MRKQFQCMDNIKGDNMNYTFEDCTSGIIETATKVKIEKEIVDRISMFVSKLTEKKSKEMHHMVDDRKESKRFTTGFLGEAALEKVLGMPIIDWTIGDSESYHIPDIPGYKVGIKTVEYGKFPIIFKQNYYSQIICVVDTLNIGTVYVCGIATPEVLNKYQDDELILDTKLRARGTKTAFYGFNYLKPITGINDIENLRKEDRDRHTILYSSRAVKVGIKKCPECNRDMIMKRGRYGDFWGCTGFPYCRHTENV